MDNTSRSELMFQGSPDSIPALEGKDTLRIFKCACRIDMASGDPFATNLPLWTSRTQCPWRPLSACPSTRSRTITALYTFAQPRAREFPHITLQSVVKYWEWSVGKQYFCPRTMVWYLQHHFMGRWSSWLSPKMVQPR